ncbi:hypothetical protein [Lacticaseibacillus saniviri]|uniref:hypothetical protein n=1 Tax=Lacticaseibacillus saniviri TaxID=931533 RepID=UPI0006D0D922|nr:hypothetical protein [Lacticaseibacillus saniviri]
MNKRQKQKSDKRLMEISWSDIQKHPDIAAIKAGALLWALSNSDDLLTIVVANHNIDRLFGERIQVLNS